MLSIYYFSHTLEYVDNIASTRPFCIFMILSFRYKKHLFDVGRRLNNPVLSKSFLGITVLQSIRQAFFLFQSLLLPQLSEGLNNMPERSSEVHSGPPSRISPRAGPPAPVVVRKR